MFRVSPCSCVGSTHDSALQKRLGHLDDAGRVVEVPEAHGGGIVSIAIHAAHHTFDDVSRHPDVDSLRAATYLDHILLQSVSQGPFTSRSSVLEGSTYQRRKY